MPKYRFYRGKLATIVWNPEEKKPLAEFVRGQFVTTNKRIADKLTEMGYQQVPLDAEAPPPIPPDPLNTEGPEVKDIRIKARTEAHELAQLRRYDSLDDDVELDKKPKAKNTKASNKKNSTTLKRRNKS